MPCVCQLSDYIAQRFVRNRIVRRWFPNDVRVGLVSTTENDTYPECVIGVWSTTPPTHDGFPKAG